MLGLAEFWAAVQQFDLVIMDEASQLRPQDTVGAIARGSQVVIVGDTNEGGHRRLNVLFTRAKYQTIVFTSMDPARIRTDENSKWGVRALKGYLRFAKEGFLDSPVETGREVDSEFEAAVIDALRTAGFEAVPQVGVAGYFIDIGVRHPKKGGEFALGIECDGAMYHSTKSARDRDRLREEVLVRLKWRIHRIWSLDWYRNSKRETERLLKAVHDAIAASA